MSTFDPSIFAGDLAAAAVPSPMELLRRSLAGGRLAHAYLFLGEDGEVLVEAAQSLASLMNCETPSRRAANGRPLVACGRCLTCQRIARRTHPDVVWIRPQNKLRQIDVAQAREVIHQLSMKATEAAHKVAVFVDADRLNPSAANAFLKTLEEPPAGSIILLLSREPERLLETILSRCQRLNFGTGGRLKLGPAVVAWLREFARQAALPESGLLPRYQLLGTLLNALAALRAELETLLTAASPLEKYPDASPEQRERWEDELKAAVESDYRLRRGEYLIGFQAWLRDVWLVSLGQTGDLANFPDFATDTALIGRRRSPNEAADNVEVWEHTQRLLFSNVQEALALEVGLLKLRL